MLDPAHGGADGGILLGDHVYEKDITLELATKLRAALVSAGFTVISTHDSDAFDPLTTDQRAELANRTRAVACIVIHASNSGSGVHLYTSALQPPQAEATYSYWPGAQPAFTPTPWESAQAAFVNQSLRMAGSLNSALGAAHLPSFVGHEPVRPLDNLTCPAIALELSPLPATVGNPTSVTDPNYQQRVASTLAAALLAWRNQEIPAPAAATKDSTQAGTPNPQTTRPTQAPSTPATATATQAAATQAQAAALARAAAKATAAAESAGQTAARYHTSVGIRPNAPAVAPYGGQPSGQASERATRKANASGSSTIPATHSTTGATGARSSSPTRTAPPEVE